MHLEINKKVTGRRETKKEIGWRMQDTIGNNNTTWDKGDARKVGWALQCYAKKLLERTGEYTMEYCTGGEGKIKGGRWETQGR